MITGGTVVISWWKGSCPELHGYHINELWYSTFLFETRNKQWTVRSRYYSLQTE